MSILRKFVRQQEMRFPASMIFASIFLWQKDSFNYIHYFEIITTICTCLLKRRPEESLRRETRNFHCGNLMNQKKKEMFSSTLMPLISRSYQNKQTIKSVLSKKIQQQRTTKDVSVTNKRSLKNQWLAGSELTSVTLQNG